MKLRNDLVTVVDGYLRIPALFVNAAQGQTWGFELAANWRAANDWRLQLAYSHLRVDLQNQPGFFEHPLP
ncbi:MAG: hypothetical protein U1F70_13300 [Candidatus Competibacteraceae bacterium]